MAGLINNLHKKVLLRQLEQSFFDLQYAVQNNAASIRQAATDQIQPVAAIASQAQLYALGFLVPIQKVINIQNSPAKLQFLLDMISTAGWTAQDLTDIIQYLRPPLIAFRDAPKTTYAEILTACNTVLAAIDPPLNFWNQ